MTSEKPKKKRKNSYVPHLAAARFKPTEDWSVDEAYKLFKLAKFEIEVDTIHYEDCLRGMDNYLMNV